MLHRPLLVVALCVTTAHAQDLEPRRWTHLPDGTNVLAIAVAEAAGDLGLDPVLMVEDADVERRTGLVSLVHAFGMAGRSARVDLLVPYDNARWEGLVAGTPADTRRTGFGDARIRLSVNLTGSPALSGKEYLEFRQSHPVNTVIGAGLAVTVPTGEYQRDKLLNLGENRYTIRPQLGVLHTRGPWSFELTGSASFFSDNRDFAPGGVRREQDAVYDVQAHVVRVLARGWWVSAGAAYGWSGESTVDGDDKNDRRGDWLAGLSFGFPLSQTESVKIAWLRRRTTRDVGSDSDALAAAWSVRF